MDPFQTPDHGRAMFAAVPLVAPASPAAPVNAPGRISAMIGTPALADAAEVAAVADRAAAPAVADRAFFTAGVASPGVQSIAQAEEAPITADTGPGISGRLGSSAGAPLAVTFGAVAGRTAAVASKPPAVAE